MSAARRQRVLFVLFFVSGLCGLAYQVVWLRLAFAAFGIITPVMSVVISVFMLGLGVGSWLAGRVAQPFTRRTGRSALWLYGVAEVVIGLSAFVVPVLFVWGQSALLDAGSLDSARYLVLSALVLGGAILPWCVAMGATYPLVMAYVREVDHDETTSFSFLYLANVIGAMTGTLVTALILIEVLGLRGTLLACALGNFGIAAVAFAMSRGRAVAPPVTATTAGSEEVAAGSVLPRREGRLALVILFFTGLASMGAEVVWIRNFTPVLNTMVYSFALILFVYLLATWTGSLLYRRHVARERVLSTATLVAIVACVSWLPVVLTDPRLHQSGLGLLLSVFPFCFVLGYLTPKLVDEYAAGSPVGGGRAYAINVFGSIVGPLVASYLLLPLFGARMALVVLCAPFLLLLVPYWRAPSLAGSRRLVAASAAAALLLCSVFVSRSLEEGVVEGAEVRRDHTATVISAGEGMEKQLLVNGIGMTLLLPVTKVMGHMPLAFLETPPERAAVICLGMGGTFRSLASWGIDTTAIELVQSVRDAFPFYFDDAAEVLASDRARIVVDDGRRFLRRTEERFDVLTIDPAPPVQASGSSLLYSAEFYELVKARLAPRGVLHHWYPGGGDLVTLQAVARSLVEAFPHVRAYRSVEGWGMHFIATMEDIPPPDAETFVARMPEAARLDLVEWNEGERRDPVVFAREILSLEMPMERLLNPDTAIEITDDSPMNEYYLLRYMRAQLGGR